jgi:hypothetical protein
LFGKLSVHPNTRLPVRQAFVEFLAGRLRDEIRQD